ncbi:MAG: aspartate aminotransferase family protein [Pseudomonadota bacterium]
MSRILHRNARATPPVAVRGQGVYLYDRDGKQYLDGSGGAAVSCLGHGHPEVVEAMRRQAGSVAYAHTGFFTSEVAEELADFLIQRSPGLGKAYFVTGGSEAMEAALKIARQYFLERGEHKRKHFIARRQSYHGNTLGALAVGGNQWRRVQFEPMLIDAHHIAPCYPYRDQGDDESEFEYGQRIANELEEKIGELGAESVIAFIAEPVVGATAGALTPVPGYFKRVREICDAHGILLILDEVMCGMGRTGTLFACEQEGIEPDIAAVAKGLGGGYQPIGAMLMSDEIFSAIESGSGFFQHGHTYLGHPMSCAAALSVQKIVERDDLLENVRSAGASLKQALGEQFSEHPNVGDVRGRGLFIGLELVAERSTKTPFELSVPLHKIVKQQAMAAGLMCYPMSGTIDGQRGHHILLAPPYIIDHDHIDEIVKKLSLAIDETCREVSAA